MPNRKHPTVYHEDTNKINRKICEMLQAHFKLAEKDTNVLWDKIDEILDETFQYPDYYHQD